MELLVTIASIVGIGLLAGYLVLRHEARDTIRAFQMAFPGRCPVCSFHAYGVREGLTDPSPVAPHDCPEKRA